MKPGQLAFKCRFEDTKNFGEEWTEIADFMPEWAATTFADQMDCHGDYDIIRRGESESPVEVMAPDGHVTKWKITAESVPHYYARQITAGG